MYIRRNTRSPLRIFFAETSRLRDDAPRALKADILVAGSFSVDGYDFTRDLRAAVHPGLEAAHDDPHQRGPEGILEGTFEQLPGYIATRAGNCTPARRAV